MSISHETLALMQCPSCAHPDLYIRGARLPELGCPSCDLTYPILDGIPDMVPPTDTPTPGTYRTETWSNLTAGSYDMIAPLMSAGVWNCSPLRFVDSENRALGRANHGVYLKAPIGTGLVLRRVLADYHKVHILGVDRSWNMLRQAQRHLRHSGHTLQLFRVDYSHLPFKPGVIQSAQSFNGVHAFRDRHEALQELKRCLVPGGFMSGSALVRGNEAVADFMLDQLERWGVYPMLRTAELFRQEFSQLGLSHLTHETHGAVMFYCGDT